MRSTLSQAILAVFCAILCNLSALGGGGMNIGARTSCWSGNKIPYQYEKYDFVYSTNDACMLNPHIHSGSTYYNISCTYYPLTGFNVSGCNLFQGAINDGNWIGGFFGAGFFIGTLGGIYSIPIIKFQRNTVTIDRSGQNVILSVDGSEVINRSISGGASKAYMGILTQSNGKGIVGGRAPYKVGIESFSYIDGDYKCELFAVKNKDTNECGMYDVINRVFLSSVTSNKLNVGNYA